ACIAVFCADTKYYLEDGCAATQNLLLAAAGYGIGSCWVAGDKKPYCSEVAKLLGAPDSLKLVSLVALGYPASEASLKEASKKALNQLLHWEKF
ncbi:MAG: nitroreductase family protein, partial [Candidatus Omnitrophota bacterium]